MASRYWVSTSDTNWNVAANWNDTAGATGVPAAADDIYIANNSTDITAFDASATALNSLTIDQSYTGKIGGSNSYLKVGLSAKTLTIGRQPGDANATGSGRIHISGTIGTVNVIDTCSSAYDTGLPPVCLAGTITTLNVRSGKVGVAVITPVETATATTVNVTRADTATTSPTVILAAGVTTTTINGEAGRVINKSNLAITTATITGSEYRVEGDGAHTTLAVESGQAVINGIGTITTLNAYAAQVDFSNDPRAKTITNCNLYPGANLNLQTGVKGSVTVTNGVKLIGCDLNGVTLRVGNDRTLTLS